MAGVEVDLLPRDAELARRSAGGDGAAFVRLYDRYSEEIFAAALAAGGSTETAAKATQTAFLRLLRRPPALDAPDSEVAAWLRRLLPGGPVDPAPANGTRFRTRAVHVGWLRSETVAIAGGRFDDDWSVHLWTPERQPEPEPEPEPFVEQEPLEIAVAPTRSRRRLALPRLGVPSPSAGAVLVGLTLLGGVLGTFLTSGSDNHTGLAPEAATNEPAPRALNGDARRHKTAGETPAFRGALTKPRLRGGN